MMFITLILILYFIKGELDTSLIGKELGLMKDELDGKVIKEAYFLGIKQYGYYYYDTQGNKINIYLD